VVIARVPLGYVAGYILVCCSNNASVIFTDPPVDSLSYIGELDTPIV